MRRIWKSTSFIGGNSCYFSSRQKAIGYLADSREVGVYGVNHFFGVYTIENGRLLQVGSVTRDTVW